MGEISQLLFPERCVGCSQSHGLLCKRCSREWGFSIRNSIDCVPLISTSYYSLSISHIILRAKENNDSRARRVLANAIAIHITQPRILIPIPSSPANNRRRGYDHSLLLAKEVARLSGSKVWPALRIIRKVRDQTQLAHAKRFINLSGSYALDPSILKGNEFGREVVLIDDLVTTGASMREAIRALSVSGEFGEGKIRPIQAISACIATHNLPNTISPY